MPTDTSYNFQMFIKLVNENFIEKWLKYQQKVKMSIVNLVNCIFFQGFIVTQCL